MKGVVSPLCSRHDFICVQSAKCLLAVLGAHEGEGLALEAGGAHGAAGSRSHFISSRGQVADYRIIEVGTESWSGY